MFNIHKNNRKKKKKKYNNEDVAPKKVNYPHRFHSTEREREEKKVCRFSTHARYEAVYISKYYKWKQAHTHIQYISNK